MFQTEFVENMITRFIYSAFFFRNRVFYEITWKNILETGRPHMTMWRMPFACWITKATNTHTEYVILIALPRQ
jgi:hypothetical protein